MRLLSKESAELAKATYQSHGSWKAAKNAGIVREDGVVVLKRDGKTGRFKASEKPARKK